MMAVQQQVHVVCTWFVNQRRQSLYSVEQRFCMNTHHTAVPVNMHLVAPHKALPDTPYRI
jgi:hypothetical protein